MVNEMNDETQLNNGGLDPMPSQEELMKMLKDKARMMGISFSNNIGYEALLKKVSDKQEGIQEEEQPVAQVDTSGMSRAEQLQHLRKQIVAEQMALVRIRVTCMDPKKKDLEGEIFCVANEFIGNVKKFVPFGEATDNGYHVPKCILTMMQERKYLQITSKVDPRTGIDVPHNRYVREFAIEILEPLTPAELKKLGTAQIAAGTSTIGTDD